MSAPILKPSFLSGWLSKHGFLYRMTVLLSVFFVVFMLRALYAHGGYFGYDDMEYCRLAWEVSRGNFSHGDLYTFRYMGFLPLALYYKIFGVHDFSNLLLSLVYLLGIGYGIMRILPGSLGVGAALLYFMFQPTHLMYVEKPMPDIAAELGFFMGFYSVYAIRFKAQLPFDTIKYVVLFLLGAIVSFLSKESFVVYYPYFLFFFIWDLYKQKFVDFWLWSLGGGALFLGIYFISYWMMEGDAWIRVKAIFTNRYVSDCSYDFMPAIYTVRRVLYTLWLVFVENGYLLPLVGLIAVWSHLKKQASLRITAYSWLALLFLANFMSIRYTEYVPLCDDPRHFLFVLPVGALLVGQSIAYTEFLSRRALLFIGITVLVLWIISMFNGYAYRYWMYLPLLVVTFVSFWYRRPLLWALAWGMSMCGVFFVQTKYHHSLRYEEQKELLFATSDSGLIFTDSLNHRIASFQLGFEQGEERLRGFESLEEMEPMPSQAHYILINGLTMYMSGTSWEQLPEQVRLAHERYPIVLENASGILYLY